MLSSIKQKIAATRPGQWLAMMKLRIEAASRNVPDALPVAYRTTVDGVEELRPVEAKGETLPRPLCVHGGLFRVYGRVWDCSAPGVYRFCLPHWENTQRVVLDATDPVRSALLLSLLVVRGSADDFLTPGAAVNAARSRLLVMTCGPASDFIAQRLAENDIPCRVVGTRVVGDLNGYADGHVMVEVGGGNAVVDVDASCWFVGDDSLPMTLFDVCSAVAQGRVPRVERAALPDLVDWAGFTGGSGYAFGFLEYLARADAVGMEKMYARVLAVPYIRHGRDVLYTCLSNRPQPPESGWQWLEPEDFRRLFYAPK